MMGNHSRFTQKQLQRWVSRVWRRAVAALGDWVRKYRYSQGKSKGNPYQKAAADAELPFNGVEPRSHKLGFCTDGTASHIVGSLS